MPLWQQPTFPRLLLALVLGAAVGAERQWRQRPAGMRTNTLVCLGAAAFADLGTTMAGPNSTGVIAYIVSGVGFLGAGAIMKEGANVRGLNTAATLWCSAAVGACAGAGEMLDAVFVAALLISINLVLRPISRFIDRQSLARTRVRVVYRLTVRCDLEQEGACEAELTRGIKQLPLVLRQLHSDSSDGHGEVSMQAIIESESADASYVKHLADDLKNLSGVISVEWAESESESE